MERRSFLAGAGVAVGAGALGGAAEAFGANLPADLPRRVLGKTGRTLPVVGFPGLALKNYDQKTCNEGVRRAMDLGVDYFDVAPAYGKDGECEIKMGEALTGISRDKYFLACKTQKDDGKEAREELERSLTRLKTDHFDLYQLHCLRKEEEVKQALGPGGALEMVLKAKEEGKVRAIGFSAHTSKSALAALDGFAFDSCMFPLNFVEWFKTGFGREVAARAVERGTALISIKPVGRGKWPQGVAKTYQWWYRPLEDPAEYQMAMNWVLSLPGMVTTVPSSFLDVFERTVAAARGSREVHADETEKLKLIAANCEPIFENDLKQQAVGYLPPELPAYPSRMEVS